MTPVRSHDPGLFLAQEGPLGGEGSTHSPSNHVITKQPVRSSSVSSHLSAAGVNRASVTLSLTLNESRTFIFRHWFAQYHAAVLHSKNETIWPTTG